MISDSGDRDHSSERSDDEWLSAALVSPSSLACVDLIVPGLEPDCHAPAPRWPSVSPGAGRPAWIGFEWLQAPRSRVRPTRSTPLIPVEQRSQSPTVGEARHAGALLVRLLVIRGSRIDGPLSSMRCAAWIKRSQMASASVGSPMASCQALTGSCVARSVELRP